MCRLVVWYRVVQLKRHSHTVRLMQRKISHKVLGFKESLVPVGKKVAGKARFPVGKSGIPGHLIGLKRHD